MTQTDPQDPLPEAHWTWRRAFTWGLTIICLILIAWIVRKLSTGEHLAGVAYGLIGLIALFATYYLIAPSAEHIVKLLRMASLLRRRP